MIFVLGKYLKLIMNKFIGSSFDDFLVEEVIPEEVEARAIKKIIAY